MTGTILLPVLVLLPMAGALLSYLVGRRNKEARNRFALLVTVAEAGLQRGGTLLRTAGAAGRHPL